MNTFKKLEKEKGKKHFLAIGSTEGKFMIDLIEWLNSYPLENPANSIIQDLGTKNPMEEFERLEAEISLYEAEEYDRQMDLYN